MFSTRTVNLTSPFARCEPACEVIENCEPKMAAAMNRPMVSFRICMVNLLRKVNGGCERRLDQPPLKGVILESCIERCSVCRCCGAAWRRIFFERLSAANAFHPPVTFQLAEP